MVELTREQKLRIERLLATGRYGDRAEVLSEALTLLERHQAAVASVRRSVEEGLADLAAGRSRSFDSTQELAAEVRKRGRLRKASRQTTDR